MLGVDTTQTNEELVRAGYDSFAAGDLAAVQVMFHPDATWHAGLLGQLSGDHDGWGAIAVFFGRTMELSGGTFTVTVEETLTSDALVAAVVTSRGERNGNRLEEQQVHLFRLEGSRVVDVRQFAGADADAFWA